MMPANGTGYWTIGEIVDYLNSKRDPKAPEWTYHKVWRWGRRGKLWIRRCGKLVASAATLRRGAPEFFAQLEQERWEREHGY